MITIDDLPEEGGIYAKTKLEWTEVDHLYIHYFYKIVNNINGKFYYGIHSILKEDPRSNDLVNDGYWGSGTAIHEAEIKYGLENFTKTVEAIFSTRAEVRLKEAEVVTQELVDDRMCYNMILGGCESPKQQGGWILVNYADESLRKEKMFSIPVEEYWENKDKYITPGTGTVIVNYRDPLLRLPNGFRISTEEYYNNPDKYINVFSERGYFKCKDNWEDIRYLSFNDPLVLSGQFVGINNGIKQSKETIDKRRGEKNGSYGSFWITNGTENKKQKKDDTIPDGWWKGRVRTSNKLIARVNILTHEKKYFSEDEIKNCSPDWIEEFLLDKNYNLITPEIIESMSQTMSVKQICDSLGICKQSLRKAKNYYIEIEKLDKKYKKSHRPQTKNPLPKSKKSWIEDSSGKQRLVGREEIEAYLNSGWKLINKSPGHYEISDELRTGIIDTFVETLSIKETSKKVRVSRKYIKENILKINETKTPLQWFKNKKGELKRTFVPKDLLPKVLAYGWHRAAPRT